MWSIHNPYLFKDAQEIHGVFIIDNRMKTSEVLKWCQHVQHRYLSCCISAQGLCFRIKSHMMRKPNRSKQLQHVTLLCHYIKFKDGVHAKMNRSKHNISHSQAMDTPKIWLPHLFESTVRTPVAMFCLILVRYTLAGVSASKWVNCTCTFKMKECFGYPIHSAQNYFHAKPFKHNYISPVFSYFPSMVVLQSFDPEKLFFPYICLFGRVVLFQGVKDQIWEN